MSLCFFLRLALALAAPAALAQPAPAQPSFSPAGASTAAASSTPVQGSRPDLAVSLILGGAYKASSLNPDTYRIGGFHAPADAGWGPERRGLRLGETELGLSAQIDPWWRGLALIGVEPEGGVSVEEASVQTTALGRGLTVKAGRFYSGIGYLNAQHAHTWDFADNPLVYQAILGTQYADDGAQLRWLAPTDQYLVLGLELGRGLGFPGTPHTRNGAGAMALTAHTGGDLGVDHNWRVGLSWLRARASGQELTVTTAAGEPGDAEFSGTTRVWVLDGVWKWAPNGNASRINFKLQGEYLRSSREGTLRLDPAGSDVTDRMRLAQSGAYLQGVFQFMPRWRVGLRGDWLQSGRANLGANAADLEASGYRPTRQTVMLDFSPNESSRLRLQLAHDRARPGAADRQLVLQYTMSLGAHAAHTY
jgi:hypothetical protein